MKSGIFSITENKKLAESIYRMKLTGDSSAFTAPGQFLNIKLNGFYLRRPISLCDIDGSEITIIYKTVGSGTEKMSRLRPGKSLDVLTGLGNGYDLGVSGNKPLLIGGGVGIPPLYLLAKRLRGQNKSVSVALGFNTAGDVFYESEFRSLGCMVSVTTADGSYGIRGFATDALPRDYSFVYSCGPAAMLKAVYKTVKTSGQYSFEERMGCGFGACMGCTRKTKNGYKRVCKDGPVFYKEEILWQK